MRFPNLMPSLPLAAALATQQDPLVGFSSRHHSPSPWRDELLRLHRGLVEAESISGAEAPAGNFICDYLSARDYELVLQFLPPLASSSHAALSSQTSATYAHVIITPSSEQPPSRFNVVARPRSKKKPRTPDASDAPDGPSPRVIVTSHLDVVPPYIPYAISDDPPTGDSLISGRGSVDAKGSMAAQVVAVENLISSGRVDPADVMLLFVVGEEVNADGMRTFSDSMAAFAPPLDPEAVVFGEPTENRLACGHKGALIGSVSANGVAGHSGYPWLGRSANEVLVRALAKIAEVDLGSSDKFGNTTVNIGKMAGGVAANVIASHSRADLMVRVAVGPEQSGHREVQRKIEEILDEVQGDDEGVFDHVFSGYGPVACECAVDGFETVLVNYGTDIPHLKGGHKRYLYGPGKILVAHSDHENLTVADLETAVGGYERLILHALGQREGEGAKE